MKNVIESETWATGLWACLTPGMKDETNYTVVIQYVVDDRLQYVQVRFVSYLYLT